MDTPEVRAALADWMEYKRKRGQAYKDPAGQLSRLLKKPEYSGEPETFCAAVDHSIASNYAGCYPAPKGGSNAKGNAAKRGGRIR